MGIIDISPFQNVAYMNITMTTGYMTNFAVTMGTSIINTSVNISLANELIVVNSNSHGTLLPEGNFTFTASTNTTVSSNNYTESISFTNSTVIDINTAMSVQLTLQKLYIYNLNILEFLLHLGENIQNYKLFPDS